VGCTTASPGSKVRGQKAAREERKRENYREIRHGSEEDMPEGSKPRKSKESIREVGGK